MLTPSSPKVSNCEGILHYTNRRWVNVSWPETDWKMSLYISTLHTQTTGLSMKATPTLLLSGNIYIKYVDLGKCLYFLALQNLKYEWKSFHLTTTALIEETTTGHVQHAQQFSETIILTLEAMQSNSTRMTLIQPRGHVRVSVT